MSAAMAEAGPMGAAFSLLVETESSEACSDFVQSLSDKAKHDLLQALRDVDANEPWMREEPQSQPQPEMQRMQTVAEKEAEKKKEEERKAADDRRCVVVFGSIALDLVAEVASLPDVDSNSTSQNKPIRKVCVV